MIDVPNPVAGRPRLFTVPLIDMVNIRCHLKRADARIRPLAPALTNPVLEERDGYEPRYHGRADARTGNYR